MLLATLFYGCSTTQDKLAPENWPQSRADAALTGYTTGQLPAEPKLRWSYSGDVRTLSSPVVKGDTVFWCDRKGLISGVRDGKLVFSYDLGSSVESTPLIVGSTLYIGRINGLLTAVSIPSRDTLWNYETQGQISATPNVADDGSILVGSYDNLLYHITENGKLIGSYPTGYYINGAVSVNGDRVALGGCDSWVRVIDLKRGIVSDSILADSYIPNSPIIDQQAIYVADYQGSLYRIENSVSEKIMEAPSDGEQMMSMAAISPDAIYLYYTDKHLYKIDKQDSRIIWKRLLGGDAGESSPLVCDSRVIACSKNGIVYILSCDDGEILWQYDTGQQIIGSPAVTKSGFYILTAKGTLMFFQ